MNNNNIALLKFNGITQVPSELRRINSFNPSTDTSLNPPYTIDDFRLSDLIENTSKPIYNVYSDFKTVLSLPDSELNSYNNWKKYIVRKVQDTEGERISFKPAKIFNPIDILSVYFERLLFTIQKTLDQFSMDHLNSTKLKYSVYFTQPAYGSDGDVQHNRNRSENYRKNILKVLDAISKKEQYSRFNFPQLEKRGDFLYEAYSIFYYYKAFQGSEFSNRPKSTFLIIDIGASTTDVAIIQINSKGNISTTYPVVSTTEFAGRDIDKAILKYVLKDEYNVEYANDYEILNQVEHIKNELMSTYENSKNVTAASKIRIEQLNKEFIISVIDIKEVIEEIWPYFKEAIDGCIEKARTRAEEIRLLLNFDKFENIFLAGGCTKLPFLTERILEEFADVSKGFFSSKGYDPGCLGALGQSVEHLFTTDDNYKNYLIARAEKVFGEFITDSDNKLNVLREFTSRKDKEYKEGLSDFLFYINELPRRFVKDDFKKIRLTKLPKSIEVKLRTELQSSYQSAGTLICKYRENTNSEFSIKGKNKLELNLEFAELGETDGDVEHYLIEPAFILTGSETNKDVIAERITEPASFPINLTVQEKIINKSEVIISIDFGMRNTSASIFSPEIDFSNIEYSKYFQVPSQKHENLSLKPIHSTFGEVYISVFNEMTEAVKNIETQIKLLNEHIIDLKKDGNRNSKVIDNHFLSELLVKEKKDYGCSINKEEICFERFVKFIEEENKKHYKLDVLQSVWSQLNNEYSLLTILAGSPGTGKSSLIQDIARYFYREKYNKYYTLISVSPSWFSPDSLLGYVSDLNNEFKLTEFVKIIYRAENSYNEWLKKKDTQTVPSFFFICLDEFNIAQPELYFSEILSKMEMNPKKLEIPGTSITLNISPNIKIFGTINTDSASKMLSPKVMDRVLFARLNPGIDELTNYSQKLILESNLKNKEQLKLFHDLFTLPAKNSILFHFNNLFGTFGQCISFRMLKQIIYFIDNHPQIENISRDNDRSYVNLFDQVISSILIPKIPAQDIFENNMDADIRKILSCFENIRINDSTSYAILEAMMDKKFSGQAVHI